MEGLWSDFVGCNLKGWVGTPSGLGNWGLSRDSKLFVSVSIFISQNFSLSL